MVIDLNKYSPGQPIVRDTFWIIEQIPGMTRSADMSSFLAENNYWPSFNQAYFADIYAVSGLPLPSSINGQGGDYINSPRFKIFTRDQAQVTTMAGMMHILQYNDWQHDPLQLGSPDNGIASRYDLLQDKALAFGGIDSKARVQFEISQLQVSNLILRRSPRISSCKLLWPERRVQCSLLQLQVRLIKIKILSCGHQSFLTNTLVNPKLGTLIGV